MCSSDLLSWFGSLCWNRPTQVQVSDLAWVIALSSDRKPPAPFPEALYAIPVSPTTIDHADKCVASSSSPPVLDCVPTVDKIPNEPIESSTGTPAESKTVQLNAKTSGIFQKRLPEKYDDPGMFTIPIRIGRFRIRKALLDLGASINVLPYRAYLDLELGPLTETDIKVQLADGTFITPRGIVENALVQVEELVFPVDFFVLDMQDKEATGPFMLGRPFMKTSRTKIDSARIAAL